MHSYFYMIIIKFTHFFNIFTDPFLSMVEQCKVTILHSRVNSKILSVTKLKRLKKKLSRPVSADKCSEWPWTRPSFWLDVTQIGGFGFEVKAYTVLQRSCFPKSSALCGLHHCIIISLHSYSVVLQHGYYHTKHQYASYFTWVCLFLKGRAKIHSDICFKCNIQITLHFTSLKLFSH